MGLSNPLIFLSLFSLSFSFFFPIFLCGVLILTARRPRAASPPPPPPALPPHHCLTHTHSRSLTLIHTHSHSLTYSLARSLTHSHSLTHGSYLQGQDVVACAAGGVRNRRRRSTLAMSIPKSWQAQHSVHLGACLCGRGSIRQLSRGTGCCRARGRGCAKSWQAQHFGDAVAEVVAGAAFCASGCVFMWQG